MGISARKMEQLIKKAAGKTIDKWTTKNIEEFKSRVESIVYFRAGRPSERNVARMFYNDYKNPKRYVRTRNLFNNVMRIKTSSSSYYFWDKQMDVSFSWRFMNPYYVKKGDQFVEDRRARQYVFNIDFLQGYHGRYYRGPMSPPPYELIQKEMKKSWERFTKESFMQNRSLQIYINKNALDVFGEIAQEYLDSLEK